MAGPCAGLGAVRRRRPWLHGRSLVGTPIGSSGPPRVVVLGLDLQDPLYHIVVPFVVNTRGTRFLFGMKFLFLSISFYSYF